MQSFRELLDPRILSASYAQRDGVRSYYLTDTFFKGPRNVEGHEYTLVYYPAMMEPAPGNVPGAEARVLVPNGATERRASLFANFNKVLMPGEVLNALREPDSLALQEMGATTVARVYDDFAERHNIFKELIVAKILTTGRVNMNAAGQILESSVHATTGVISDAANTLISADFAVANSHRGNLGGIISALWSASTTTIATQLDALRDAAEAANVETPTDIYLHPTSKQHLRDNDEFVEWAAYNNRATDTVLRGDMIEGLWGFNWHFYGGKYLSAAGTMLDYIPPTRAIIAPPANRPWLRPSQGSTLVPSQIGVMADWQEALRNTTKYYGKYSYAKLLDDPMALYLYMGDLFVLNFADPNAIWMPTVFA